MKENRERYAQNIDKERARSKQYKSLNVITVKLQRNKAMKIKRATNPAFKLRCNVSRLIRRALLNNGGKKGLSFLKFVDYDMKTLQGHLEFLFEPWMNWSNWGRYQPTVWDDNVQKTWTWQIDHIIHQSNLVYKHAR